MRSTVRRRTSWRLRCVARDSAAKHTPPPEDVVAKETTPILQVKNPQTHGFGRKMFTDYEVVCRVCVHRSPRAHHARLGPAHCADISVLFQTNIPAFKVLASAPLRSSALLSCCLLPPVRTENANRGVSALRLARSLGSPASVDDTAISNTFARSLSANPRVSLSLRCLAKCSPIASRTT